MLLFEGLIPLLMPKSWRDTFKKLIEMSDNQLRAMGFIAVTLGFILVMLSS